MVKNTYPLCDEYERLRNSAIRVVAAFENLGLAKDVAGLLVARSRCESAMLELQSVLANNA